MSVINNVLKNLESRESHFTPIEINSLAADSAPARDLKPLLLIGVVLVLLATVAWVYLQGGIFPTTTQQPVPVSASIAPVVPEPVVESSIEAETGVSIVTEQMIPNQIIGLQIRESEGDMHLEFALREKVVAYLRERGENSFGYHLRDVESLIVAPHMSDNQWIRELSILSSEAGVDINFQTATDILVETRQDSREQESVWIIKLRKSIDPDDNPPAVEVAQNSESPVSTTQSSPAPVDLVPSQPAEKVTTVEMSTQPVEIDIKSTNPNTDSINRLEYAVELINSNRIAEAEALLQGLLDGVEDYSAREHLLALYARQKMTSRAQRLLRESIAKYPQSALFKTEYGRSLYQATKYRAVIEFFANEIDADANQQALVASSHQRLDEHEAAVRYYQLALAQDPSNPRNWIGLGISQENIAALEEALSSYQRAARLGGLNNRLRAFIDVRSNTLQQVLN